MRIPASIPARDGFHRTSRGQRSHAVLPKALRHIAKCTFKMASQWPTVISNNRSSRTMPALWAFELDGHRVDLVRP